ncbi:BamA/TamA family outer membrane protein [Shewanella donghaensis]|uniref:hypothetical protein n=1 Tax=Shewanella donghaensis TaxID=238836 RepID=UPI001182F8AC|nr:hypothetical protein [Shewanella donghaensis]
MQLYKSVIMIYCVFFSVDSIAQSEAIHSVISNDSVYVSDSHLIDKHGIDKHGIDKHVIESHARDSAVVVETSESDEQDKSDKQSSSATSTKELSPEFVAVPIIFSTETLSTTYGAAGVVKHAGQAQAVALGIGLYSANDSWLSYAGFYNYQLPKLDQWLFSAEVFRGHYEEGIYYLPNSSIPEPKINDTNRVISVGDEGFTKLTMEYVLPIARGKHGAVSALGKSRDDISWNPFESGVSSISLTPFNKYRELETLDYLADEARGVELAFNWDNRDTKQNSSEGGQTNLTITKGFSVDDDPSWLMWEFEQSAFVSFDANSWFEQQVLAFNMYLADTPSWNDYDSHEHVKRPPSFAGVSLGGFDRLRGYSSQQFTGRSAVNYAVEYRVMPQWQPLQALPVFNLYNIPWWQWALFIEAGNVTNEFELSALHEDMKTNYGVGMRFEVEGIVVRTDFVTGGEESQFWVMVNQPF